MQAKILLQKIYKSTIAKQRQLYTSVLRKHVAPKYAQVGVLGVVAWWICALKLQYVSQNGTLCYLIIVDTAASTAANIHVRT